VIVNMAQLLDFRALSPRKMRVAAGRRTVYNPAPVSPTGA
jgi:hypothetical protein